MSRYLLLDKPEVPRGLYVKKALMILGGVFLAIVVIAMVGISILDVKGNALDKESKEYADAAILAVIAGWDIMELEKRASPEFTSAVKGGDLEKLFIMFQKLGKLKEYKGSKGQANISVTVRNGRVITAAYLGSAEFEKGTAEIQLTLIKHGDQWQILGFRVNSKVLLEQS